MDRSTAEKIQGALSKLSIRDIELTGGAPEMNPNLKLFIEGLSRHGKKLTVRTNLTILEIPDYSFHLELYKQYRIHIMASLPSIFKGITDRQRGGGVFHSSIKILKKLNEMGYGTNGLQLDLVYNPPNADLPPEQNQLEKEYKELLKNHYGIIFSHLILLVNCPVTRFKDFLARQGRYHQYMDLLKKNYNPKTWDLMMCRNLISVDDKGHVYDCDFNLAAGMRIKGYENKKLWEIDFNRFEPEIALGEHCYACTVNQGSH